MSDISDDEFLVMEAVFHDEGQPVVGTPSFYQETCAVSYRPRLWASISGLPEDRVTHAVRELIFKGHFIRIDSDVAGDSILPTVEGFHAWKAKRTNLSA